MDFIQEEEEEEEQQEQLKGEDEQKGEEEDEEKKENNSISSSSSSISQSLPVPFSLSISSSSSPSLCDICCDFYINIRNGIKSSFSQLEDLSRNNSQDLISIGYYFLALERCVEFNDQNKSIQTKNQIKEMISNMTQQFPMNSFDYYLNNITNKHELFIYSSLFEIGVGVEKNPEIAFRLCQLSAGQELSLAESMLGYYYDQGFGVLKNEEISFNYYMRAAKKGFSVAQCNIGTCYERGFGVEKDLQKAVYWYELAAQKGFIGAQNYLGRCYEYGYGVQKSYEKCFEWYKKSADRGNAEGQYVVGWCYLHGKGINKNEEEAIDWWRKSITQEFSFSQYSLGSHYLSSNDPFKQKEGYDLIRKAATNKLPEAQHSIGLQYYCGTTLERMNEEEAIKWFKLSAENGYWKSLSQLGKFHHYGCLLNQDRKESLNLIHKATQNGSISVQYLRSVYYIQDEDEPSNQMKGFEYLKEMDLNAEYQYMDVMCSIGMCYENGLGVESDQNKACYWYSKSSGLGYAPGHYLLGRCYEEGNGIEVNLIEAKRLYLLAAEEDIIDAKMRLKEFNEDELPIRMNGNKRKYELLNNKISISL